MATHRRALTLALLVTIVVATSGTVLGVAPAAGGRYWPVAQSATGATDVDALPLVRVAPLSARARLGETIAFVAEVTNDAATDLVGLRVVSETDDAMTSLLGTRTDNGVFDPATSTWFIERIEAGGTATLELFARAEATGTARLGLLAATDGPAGAVGAAETFLEITSWAADADDDGSVAGVTASVLLTAGGALVVAAGLVTLSRRRRNDDLGVPAQVASDPE